MEVEVRVPFDAEAVILLPDAEVLEIQRMTAGWTGILGVSQVGNHVEVKAEAGAYAFCYQPTRPYRKIYSVDSPVEELLENEKTRNILEEEYFSRFIKISFRKELYTLAELLNGPFSYLPYEEQRALDQKLRSVE